MSYLSEWAAFYTTIGSSAAALTGLMFVVITLVAGEDTRPSRNPLGVATFSTPTVMHFCAVLYVAGTMLAPWKAVGGIAILLGLAGLYGIVYLGRVLYLATRLDRAEYEPDAEDWTWYLALPFLAYAGILASAVALPHFNASAAFGLAGASLLLIFIGIRNAWDVVTFLAVPGRRE